MRIAVTTDTHWGHSEYGDLENLRMLGVIKYEKPDILIHCGDENSSCYPQRVDYWSKVRNIFPNLWIGAVFGNHSFWQGSFHNLLLSVEELNNYRKPSNPEEIVNQNLDILKKYDISYIPNGFEFASSKVFISGCDGWYYEDDSKLTNDSRFITGYKDVVTGRNWIIKRFDEQFQKSIAEVNEHKAEGYTTIMVSHFGMIKKAAEHDYKSNSMFGNHDYMGANPKYEQFMDNVDWYFYGHSHQYYDDYADNTKTRVLNIGSDYEFPKFQLFDIGG